ncbi:MAG: phosphatase PAP2 family protein [Bacteroidales bacterium]|jgi:hypothetical protein|nr:phosphatase PAP2 family protein [Bacteroidales bacterium]
MNKSIILIFIAILLSNGLAAQTVPDSLRAGKPEVRQLIVPGSAIVIGSALSGSHLEKEVKNSFHNGEEHKSDCALPIDDLMRFFPVPEIYIADMFGVKARNNWFDQTKYLVIANAINAGITLAGKHIINKKRPGGEDYSFPSGHSSVSFTNAAVLYYEFKDTSPVLAYSGYAIATVVAGSRIVNNRHWLSDVMVGSGLGMLVTTMVYHYEPLKNWNPFKKSENITFVPSYNNNGVGFYFGYVF